jgi:hypothetical protein
MVGVVDGRLVCTPLAEVVSTARVLDPDVVQLATILAR